MDYYYSYPAHAMAEERMRMPMHPAESQARANNTSSTLLQLSRLHTMPPSHVEQQKITHESKPRLSKDQQDVLERHFQAQPKPSTTIKRGFAENLGVPLDKINVSCGPSLPRNKIKGVLIALTSTELVPEPKSKGQARCEEAARTTK